jgi:hypothetical protein
MSGAAPPRRLAIASCRHDLHAYHTMTLLQPLRFTEGRILSRRKSAPYPCNACAIALASRSRR